MSSSKERYYYLKNRRICTKCGHDSAMYGSTLCPTCSEKSEVAVAKCRSKDVDYKKKDCEAHKRMYRRREMLGLCTKCGKRKPIKGFKMCNECKIKRRKAYLKSINSSFDKTELKQHLNLCRVCGDIDLVDGKKVCKKCYTRLVKQIAYARSCVDNTNHYWRSLTKLEIEKIKNKNKC